MKRFITTTKQPSQNDASTSALPEASKKQKSDQVQPLKEKDQKKNKGTSIKIHTNQPEPSTSLEDETTLGETPAITAKKTKKIYYNKFSAQWLQLEVCKGWLEQSKNMAGKHELAHCKICSLDITAHKNDIIRHSKSERHVKKSKEIKTNQDLTKLVKTSQLQKRAELKLACFLAENNLPLAVADKMNELLPNIFTDSNIAKSLSQHRTKATAVVKNALGCSFKEELSKSLREPGSYFSIIMDETTDQSAVKQCAFVIIFYDASEVKTRFLDMQEVTSSTATGLLDCMKNTLFLNGIPLSNLVGFSSDTTNVMFGEHHSVVSLLKKEYPDVVFIKCACHLIHLVASNACLKLPRSVEDLLRNIGSHFSRSSHRQNKFVEFQTFFAVEIHKILTASTTRWLSLKQCVDRVLEQYAALQAYLTESVFEDPSKTTEEMLSTMKNPFTVMYLEFMSYTLELFCDFNKMFQKETPLLHRVKPEVERLLKTICSNYLKVEVVKSKAIFEIDHRHAANFIGLKELYIGISASETHSKLKNDPSVPPKDLEYFLVSCRNFYVEAITQIKKRFVFSDPIFSILDILDPQVAQNLQIKSLLPVFERFNGLKDTVDRNRVEQEWRDHALLDHDNLGLNHSLPVEDYWRRVFNLKNTADQPLFGNLSIVIRLLLVLPFSNACVERVFSTLNNIKTVHRNRLKTETIVSLMLTKEGVEEQGGTKMFEPSSTMMKAKIWD